jgi:hypothetical protein
LAETLLHGGVAPGAPRLNLRYQQARARVMWAPGRLWPGGR